MKCFDMPPAAMLDVVKHYFDCVRMRLGGNLNVHPRQGPVLGKLLANEGMSQADLARELGVTAATVAVSVARLEKLGYIRREKNAQNQRANVLTLTKEGRREAMLLQAAFRETGRIAVQGFSEEELTQLESYCARMAQNLRAQAPMGEE